MEAKHQPVTFTVSVDTDGSPISFEQLSFFFLLFQAIYVFAVEELESDTRVWREDNLRELYQFTDAVERRIQETPGDYMTVTGATRDENLDLRIIDIRRRNPLDFILWGALPPIVTGCIMAGGILFLSSKRAVLPDIFTSNRRMAQTLGVGEDGRIRKKRKPEP